MEGDLSRGQAETTRDEVTSGVSASNCRTQQLVGLSNGYCNRIALAEPGRITLLARRLAERFATFGAYPGRCPKSIVAACIYIACSSTENDISYATLVAATGVNIAFYYTTHTMMAFDLLYDKISVQDIADSMHIDIQLLM